MISNQILQSTIDGLKNITRKDLSVIEKEGKVIATTEEEMAGEQLDGINDFIWGNGRKVDFVTAENPDVSVLLGLHYLAEKEYGDEKQ